MKINITDEIRQEILDMLNRDTAKEYFEKLRDTEKNPTRGQVYAYRSWEQSTEDRADMFEVRALPWGSQIKDGVMKEFVAALTAADIDEIILEHHPHLYDFVRHQLCCFVRSQPRQRDLIPTAAVKPTILVIPCQLIHCVPPST